MRAFLTSITLFVALIATSQVTTSIELVAQHEGLVGDVDLSGYNTYKLYLHFQDEMDYAYILWGDEDFPMEVNTDSSFYQSMFGGSTSSNINPAYFSFIPDLQYDSYMGIGFEDSNGPTIFPVGGSPDWSAAFEAGGNLSVNDSIGGAIISLNAHDLSQTVLPMEDNKLFIGQFTTKGNLWGILNLDFIPEYEVSQVYVEPSEVIGLEFGSQSGLIPGCTDPAAQNYDSLANVLWDCQYAYGDLSGDGEVNIADLLVLLGGIGCLEDCGDSDLNGDGIVNISDLLIFLSLL